MEVRLYVSTIAPFLSLFYGRGAWQSFFGDNAKRPRPRPGHIARLGALRY